VLLDISDVLAKYNLICLKYKFRVVRRRKFHSGLALQHHITQPISLLFFKACRELIMSNPALSLSPDLILGLLGELPGILQERDSAVISAFYDILYTHPVARSTRERSLAPSNVPSGSLSGPSEIIVACPPAVQSATGEQSTGSAASASDLSAAPDHDGVAVQQAGVSAIQENSSSRDVKGKSCCRNGAKRVVLRRDKKGKRGKRDIQDVNEDSSGVTDEVNGPAKRVRRDKSSRLDEGQEEHHDVSQKRERGGKRKDPDWMTNGMPPPLEPRTMELIDQLSRLDLNDGLQSLITLANRLILPVTASENPLYSLAAVIADCHQRESNVVLESFNHMISLIRLAFYIEQ
jgi:hypothetical protein